MRKLVRIVIELDTALAQSDNRKQTWVTRMIETAAAAHLDPKDVAALLDRKGIAACFRLPHMTNEGSFSRRFDLYLDGHLCNRVADDAGPDRWAFLWFIHPTEFPIAYDLIRRFAMSRKVTDIGPGPR